jgi:hypothetical protein
MKRFSAPIAKTSAAEAHFFDWVARAAMPVYKAKTGIKSCKRFARMFMKMACFEKNAECTTASFNS